MAAHPHSYRIARLELRSAATSARLGEATGFFCRYAARFFLVTNWHVVAGRHVETGRALHASQALPGTLVVHAYVTREPWAAPRTSTAFVLPLYTEDGAPRWLEHPVFGAAIDVVAFDLSDKLPAGIEVYAIDLETELARPFALAVMDQAFVTGYPLQASTTPNSLPIYKSGTIASEPAVFDSQPRIYIDGKTKSGMSGSPVVIKPRETGPEHETLRLIGIYSGRDRQEPSEFEAELGIVWPYRECLLPILDEYCARFTPARAHSAAAPAAAAPNRALRGE